MSRHENADRNALEARMARLEERLDERLDALMTRLDEVEALVARVERVVNRRAREQQDTLRHLEYEPVAEMVAALQLLPRLGVSTGNTAVGPTGVSTGTTGVSTGGTTPPLPAVGGWAIEPSGLLAVVHAVQTRRPQLVVECGSGTSTVWLGRVLAEQGGRLISLEHDEGWATHARAMLAEHGVAEGVGQTVEIRVVPLVDVDVMWPADSPAEGGALPEVGENAPGDGEAASPASPPLRWYDPAALGDLTGIDLLLVDGPPKATGPHARYPALPLLADRLAVDAVIFADDVERPDEAATVDAWCAQWPQLRRGTAPSRRMAVLHRQVQQR